MAGSHPLTRNPRHQSAKLISLLSQPFEQLSLLQALFKVTRQVGSWVISHHSLTALSLCPGALFTHCSKWADAHLLHLKKNRAGTSPAHILIVAER